MRWLAAALAALLLAASPSSAQRLNGSYGGYSYPLDGSGCSPGCTGGTLTIKVPVFTEGVNVSVLPWLGVYDIGTTGACVGGTKPCIGQLGVLVNQYIGGVPEWKAWIELFPDQTIAKIATFVVNPGDVITLSLVCTTNCAASQVGQQWTLGIDNTTDQVVNGITATNHYTSVQNWRLKQTLVYAVVEMIGGNSGDFGSISFSNFTVQQGTGNAFFPVPLDLTQGFYNGCSARSCVLTPSLPVGVLGNEFNVCLVLGTTTYTQCPISAYLGLKGLGP